MFGNTLEHIILRLHGIWLIANVAVTISPWTKFLVAKLSETFLTDHRGLVSQWTQPQAECVTRALFRSRSLELWICIVHMVAWKKCLCVSLTLCGATPWKRDLVLHANELETGETRSLTRWQSLECRFAKNATTLYILSVKIWVQSCRRRQTVIAPFPSTVKKTGQPALPKVENLYRALTTHFCRMAAFTRKLQAAKLDYKGVEKLLVPCKSLDGCFSEASKMKPTVQP